MKIGIMGGTFNPIHIGHMHIADVALKRMNLDCVLFCPTGNSYTKDQSEIVSALDRFVMVGIAIEKNDEFNVSSVDIIRQGPTYAIDTIQQLKVIFPHDDLFFIVGTDAFNELPTWKDYDKLIKLTKFIVVKRKNEVNRVLTDEEQERVYLLDNDIETDISSTQIRKAIKENKPCKYLLPPGVYKYIETKQFYK